MNATGAAESTDSVTSVISVLWVLMCSFMIVAMQAGFAMLEVGSVREAHRMTLLAKNILDSIVSCAVFWLRSPSIVTDSKGVYQAHVLLLSWAFCATSVTISSGSSAERMHMVTYIIQAAVMAGVIYPAIADSAWGSAGFLHDEFHKRVPGHAYHDSAGAGVVHLVGGCSAFAGNWLLGRRILRPQSSSAVEEFLLLEKQLRQQEITSDVDMKLQEFEQLVLATPVSGWPRRFDCDLHDAREFKACSYLQVLGMFTLWVGWYGFNVASSPPVDTASAFAASCIVWNTSLSAAGGGLGAYLFTLGFHSKLDVGFLCNGILSGLVAITGACDVASQVASFSIGLVAGVIIYPISSRVMQMALLDDPVDAIPVHACAGIFGVLVTALCRPDCVHIAQFADGGMPEQARFCSESHNARLQLAAQAWGAFTELWWSLSLSIALYGIFALSECVRALEVTSLEHADLLLCGMVAQDGQLVQPEPDIANWKRLARNSPVLRRIICAHGWQDDGFCGGWPDDILRLRDDLCQARSKTVETALESDKFVFLNKKLIGCLGRCAFIRECSLMRLRIPPAAELSGLGAATMDGGQLSFVMQKLMQQLKQNDQAPHAPLAHEVTELALQVKNQEILLQRLARSRRLFAGMEARRKTRLQSVPEQSDSFQAQQRDVEAGRRADDADNRTGRSNEESSPFPTSDGTFETVSDRLGAGPMTPRSAVSDTPPPTIIGRSAPRTRSGQEGRVNGVNVEMAATQLVGLLQAQRQVLSALDHTPAEADGNRSPLSATPPRNAAGGHAMNTHPVSEEQHHQLLSAVRTALENLGQDDLSRTTTGSSLETVSGRQVL